jgi:hypothetical protein
MRNYDPQVARLWIGKVPTPAAIVALLLALGAVGQAVGAVCNVVNVVARAPTVQP